MIGQKNNLETIEFWKKYKTLPRLLVISGEKGSGRALMAQTIAHMFGAHYVPCELGVEAVREVVENCYKCNGLTIYVFLNAEKMSAQAKSALLKITEEPPRSAHFILTTQDATSTIDTILSRAVTLSMQPYNLIELKEYMGADYNEKILNIATTPGDINELKKLDVDAFYTFCEKVVDNIGIVSGVNAFKIGKSLKFKDEDTGYDPVLFLKCVNGIIFERAWFELGQSGVQRFVNILKINMDCLREMQMTGIKKDSTFDMWILKAREVMANATD